jgi:ABC-type phosphate transport system auxiliary subunit
MAEIKTAVENLTWAALKEHDDKVKIECNQAIEADPQISADVKKYEDCCNTINNLTKKYCRSYYVRNENEIKNNLLTKFQDNYSGERKKIKDQFAVISNSLKTMRTPDKALEFLKLCGIELPEKKAKESVVIPVDPDFIKSILPKNKMIGSAQ